MRTLTRVTLACQRRLRKLVSPWLEWRRYECMTLPWHEARRVHAALAAPPLGVEWRPLERADMLQLAADGSYEMSPAFVERLEGTDDRCFAAFVDGKVAAYGFFSGTPTAIDEQLRFRFPAQWLYVYKVFTHPAWRGRGLARHLLLNSIPALETWTSFKDHPAGLVCLIAADNHPSLSAFAHAGFRKMTSISLIAVRKQPCFVSLLSQEGFGVERMAHASDASGSSQAEANVTGRVRI